MAPIASRERYIEDRCICQERSSFYFLYRGEYPLSTMQPEMVKRCSLWNVDASIVNGATEI